MPKGFYDISSYSQQKKKCSDPLDRSNDLKDLQTKDGTASYSATLFHILVVSIGPTIFILPSAFAMVGYANAIIGIVFITFLYSYNLHSLLHSATIVQKMAGRKNLSFAEIVKYAFEKSRVNLASLAPYVYHLINILLVLSWAGELSFTIVFLADNLQDLLYSSGNTFSIHWIIIALLVPCALLTLVPCEKLSFLGALTSVTYVAFLVVVLYDLYYNFKLSRLKERAAMRPLNNLPQFLATVFFTLNFTGLAIPSWNLMKRPEKFGSVFGVLHVSLVIITCANILFGFSGYLRYGNKVKESLIMNLSLDNNTFLRSMLALYCLAIYFSYPFVYFVLFSIIWKEWVMKFCARDERSIICKSFTSLCANIIIFAIVLVVPNLRLFTVIGGLLCGIMDSFVVPAVLQILLCKPSEFAFIFTKNVVIVFFGMVLLFFGLKACVNTSVNLDI